MDKANQLIRCDFNPYGMREADDGYYVEAAEATAAIEALEFENAALKAALRAELAARGPVLSMEDFDVVDAAMDYVDAAAEEAAKECTSERDLNMAKSIADDLRNLLERAKR